MEKEREVSRNLGKSEIREKTERGQIEKDRSICEKICPAPGPYARLGIIASYYR